MAEILSIRSIEAVGVPLFYSGLDLSAGNFAYLVASCYTPYDTEPVIYGDGWTGAEVATIDDGGHPATTIGRLMVLTKANPTSDETVGLSYGHAITGHIIVANLSDAGVSGLDGGGVIIGGIGGGGGAETMDGAGETVGAVNAATSTNPTGGIVDFGLLAADPVGLIATMTQAANAPSAAPSGWENFKVQTSYHAAGFVTSIATKDVSGFSLDGTAAAFTAGSGPWASVTLVASG